MIVAWMVALLAIFIMALADPLWLFTTGWLAYGLTSWVAPALMTYITNHSGNLTSSRALAMTFASYLAGKVFSPTLGGWINERFCLRTPFTIALAFILVPR